MKWISILLRVAARVMIALAVLAIISLPFFFIGLHLKGPIVIGAMLWIVYLGLWLLLTAIIVRPVDALIVRKFPEGN